MRRQVSEVSRDHSWDEFAAGGDPIHLTCKLFKTHSSLIGVLGFTKMDEFSENFQTAYFLQNYPKNLQRNFLDRKWPSPTLEVSRKFIHFCEPERPLPANYTDYPPETKWGSINEKLYSLETQNNCQCKCSNYYSDNVGVGVCHVGVIFPISCIFSNR